MQRDSEEIRPAKTLGQYVALEFGRANRRRPISSYLLIAMLVAVLLGGQVVFFQGDPKRLAFFLALNFAFFFVIMYRAIRDCFDILRSHFREREDLISTTIGESTFTSELGRRVAKSEKNSTT